jgi:hypothetical protein
MGGRSNSYVSFHEGHGLSSAALFCEPMGSTQRFLSSHGDERFCGLISTLNYEVHMMNTNELTTKPIFKTRKKNDYVKLQEGAYPLKFEEQVEKAISALATGNLRGTTKMVRRDPRSGDYLLVMGYGKRLWWFKNNFVEKGNVAPFKTPEETLLALQEILKAAKAGEFNGALEELRIKRQKHAATMIEARDVCGFHKLEAPEAVKLLEAPKLLDETEPMLLQASTIDAQPVA